MLNDREKELLGYAIEHLASNLSEEARWIYLSETKTAEEIFQDLQTLCDKLEIDKLYCSSWD